MSPVANKAATQAFKPIRHQGVLKLNALGFTSHFSYRVFQKFYIVFTQALIFDIFLFTLEDQFLRLF